MMPLGKVKEQIPEGAIYQGFDPEAAKASPAKRLALVTGGTEGIGAVISRKLKDDGYIVAATYRNEKQAIAWQDKMENEGYLFFIYSCDLKSFAASQRLVRDVTQELGPIDILVNAAGKSFGRGRERDSAFSVTCAVMDSMIDRGFGRIINISFMNAAAKKPVDLPEVSLHKLTQELSPEISKKGITINTISPGSLPGQVFSEVFKEPEEVAEIVSFLAAEESGFVTGIDIPADGQLTMEGIHD